jgi:choline dehydrogenase-like flavoprotein
MMEDMKAVARKLGEYLPGVEPKFMPAGLALHITVCIDFANRPMLQVLTNLKGTTRMQTKNMPSADIKKQSVVDLNSKVHDYDNLWLGGCNVIPDSMACNPTRTAVRNKSYYYPS